MHHRTRGSQLVALNFQLMIVFTGKTIVQTFTTRATPVLRKWQRKKQTITEWRAENGMAPRVKLKVGDSQIDIGLQRMVNSVDLEEEDRDKKPEFHVEKTISFGEFTKYVDLVHVDELKVAFDKFDLDRNGFISASVRARLGRLSALISVLHSKSGLCGGFAWVRRALN